MEFEWDPAKSAQNFQVRGFDFGAAALVFAGFTLERPDTRRDYGEPRVVAVGRVAGVELTVVYTDRVTRAGTRIRRIISARRSSRHERQVFQAAESQA